MPTRRFIFACVAFLAIFWVGWSVSHNRNAPPSELDKWGRKFWDDRDGVLRAHLPATRPSTNP